MEQLLSRRFRPLSSSPMSSATRSSGLSTVPASPKLKLLHSNKVLQSMRPWTGRVVDAETWFKRFAEMGLQFGPSFQGYSDIRADPVKNVALNTTAGMFPGGESDYPIYPASLDLVIRLGLMACNGGQPEQVVSSFPSIWTKCGSSPVACMVYNGHWSRAG